jgi:hypothetical protein
MTEDEARAYARRIMILTNLALAEFYLGELTKTATEMTREESLRIADALERFSTARKALISPLARVLPESSTQN